MEAICPKKSPQNRILKTSIRHNSSKKGSTFSSKILERVDVETIKSHTPVRKYYESPSSPGFDILKTVLGQKSEAVAREASRF